eukprot:40837-Hanusia_phi.AAC.2
METTRNRFLGAVRQRWTVELQELVKLSSWTLVQLSRRMPWGLSKRYFKNSVVQAQKQTTVMIKAERAGKKLGSPQGFGLTWYLDGQQAKQSFSEDSSEDEASQWLKFKRTIPCMFDMIFHDEEFKNLFSDLCVTRENRSEAN